ncbi:MAG: hypothetical protein KC996_00425 [Phycisphaerales bacterium]|nr:hypothetical protein [Phycisphaerales bacterium]
MKKTMTLVAFAGCASLASATIIAQNTWDSGSLEGWTYASGTGGGEYEVPLFGGNPGGFVQYVDGTDGSAPPPQIFAPAEYLGDYTSYVGGYFEYDIILSTPPTVPGEPLNYPRLRLVGADGSEARIIADYLVDDSWQTVHVNIVESEWEMVTGTWAGLISNVSAVKLGGDVITGSGPEGGFDNFVLVPAAPTTGLLAVGMALATRRRR